MLKKMLALGLALTMAMSFSMGASAAKVVKKASSDTKTTATTETTTKSASTKTASTTSVSSNAYDFCPSQLNTLGKKVHDAFVTGLRNKQNTIKVDITGASENDTVAAFQSAVQLIINQHAEIFWLDTTMQNFTTSSDHNTLIFYPRPAATYGTANASGTAASTINTAAIEKHEKQMKAIADNIKGSTRYDLVKGIHDAVIASSEYYAGTGDKQSYHEATGCLVYGTGVCDSYAKAFKYLSDVKGVPCVVIGGTATNALGQNGTHAWNYVKMEDGQWYAVDTGWDDPVVSGGGSNEKYNYVYFMKNNVKNDTRKKDNYKYPALAASDYKAA